MESIPSHVCENHIHVAPDGHSCVGGCALSLSTAAPTVDAHVSDEAIGGDAASAQAPVHDKVTDDAARTLWQVKRAKRRERVKAAAQLRKAHLQAEWEGLSEAAQAERRAAAAVAHMRRRTAAQAHHLACTQALQDVTHPTLVFDLSFAWCMTPAATRSTVAQIKYAYSTLHHADFPLRPCITSLAGREVECTDAAPVPSPDSLAPAQLAEELRGLVDFAGFARYPPIAVTESHWSRLFPLSQVVMLTADAETVLQRIEPSTVYVIGAFVDHNRYKGLTLRAAQRHGVRVARLPIQESIDIGNRCKVLTINHVVDILTRFMQSNQTDWKSALLEVLPTRRAN